MKRKGRNRDSVCYANSVITSKDPLRGIATVSFTYYNVHLYFLKLISLLHDVALRFSCREYMKGAPKGALFLYATLLSNRYIVYLYIIHNRALLLYQRNTWGVLLTFNNIGNVSRSIRTCKLKQLQIR